jgi:hypothetical protein
MTRKVNMHTICRFLAVGNIFRLETCMNSLVKVPPYSTLNFQRKMFFTQNWCNITLKLYLTRLKGFQMFTYDIHHKAIDLSFFSILFIVNKYVSVMYMAEPFTEHSCPARLRLKIRYECKIKMK